MVDLAPPWAKKYAEQGLEVARAQLAEMLLIRKALEKIVAALPPEFREERR